MLREQRQAAEERHRIEHVESERRIEQLRVNATEHAIQRQMWAEQESARLRLAAEEEDRKRETEVKERIRRMKLDAAGEKLPIGCSANSVRPPKNAIALNTSNPNVGSNNCA